MDPTTMTGLFFSRHGIEPADVSAHTSQVAAIAGAVAGEGILLTLARSSATRCGAAH